MELARLKESAAIFLGERAGFGKASIRTSTPALRNLKIVGLPQGRMNVRVAFFHCRPVRAAINAAALLSLAVALNGCADMSDSMSTAFADPAKYQLYDCKQLEAERKNLANRSAELQGLMAKAETGVAGPVVAELAYRSEYMSVRGQAKFAEEAWEKNKCASAPPPAAPPVPPVFAPQGNPKAQRAR